MYFSALLRRIPTRHVCVTQARMHMVSRQLGTTAQLRDSTESIGLERKVRHDEDLQTMRRRLQYQMRKRGILETDLLLSTFASEHLGELSREELVDLDALLSNIDWDIFYWATKKTQPPEVIQKMAVFRKLQDHATRQGTKITRMPDLKD